MKHLTVFSLILFAATLFTDSVNAQTPVDVCYAEVYDSFRISRGKLVKVGNTLIFVDDVDLRAAFTIDRRNIRSFNGQAGIYSASMPLPMNYGWGNPRRFDFRLISGNCDRIAQWLHNVTRRPVIRPPFLPKTYWVMHKRSLRSDISGKLRISAKMIEFESPRDTSHSRRWRLKDIKTVRQDGPHELTILPFTGDQHTFVFQDKGMRSAEFRALRASIIKAPTSRY